VAVDAFGMAGGEDGRLGAEGQEQERPQRARLQGDETGGGGSEYGHRRQVGPAGGGAMSITYRGAQGRRPEEQAGDTGCDVGNKKERSQRLTFHCG